MFIEATLSQNGEPVLINLNQVQCIVPNDKDDTQCWVSFQPADGNRPNSLLIQIEYSVLRQTLRNTWKVLTV